MKSLVFVIATLSATATADNVGTATGKVEGAQALHDSPQLMEKTAGEYGDEYLQTASLNKGTQQVARMKNARSWRKTQVLLKSMKKIRCRIGGYDAKTVAILALASEGYCNKKAELTGTTKLPPGTVWVYHNEPHGNTVVKLKENVYYSNRKMSAPPPDHGDLAAIMVPGCGKKAKKCQSADALLADLKKLENAADNIKSARAEERQRLEDGEPLDNPRESAKTADADKDERGGISDQLKNAEFSCKADGAAADPDKYFACVEAIMGDH